MKNIVLEFVLLIITNLFEMIILLWILINPFTEEKQHLYFPRYFITGDKHRDFRTVKRFCRKHKTRKSDVLIILGDAGFNYYGDYRDDKLKKELSALNITLFCIHGNKENRPQNISTYGEQSFCGGRVYYEPKYSNLLFAKDGEIYTFNGQKYMVIGGAHSVDKLICLEEGNPFWDDEMPGEEIKALVEERLALENVKVFGFLTHTCPIKYLPKEMFISTRNSKATSKTKQAKSKTISATKEIPLDIDRSTEEWLGILERTISYTVWYCGHYHIDKRIDKICMLHNKILPL